MSTGDAVIIGAGPAGISASIQLARHGVSPVVFEREEVGGLLRNAWRVENYPGFPQGISGLELVGVLREQFERTGAELVRDGVTVLDYREGNFAVETSSGGSRRFRAAIVASGTRPRELPDIEIPPATEGRVLREALPLFSARGVRVAIVGAGDAAFDYALSLSRSNRVTILTRSESPRCIPLLHELASEAESIEVRRGTRLMSVAVGEDGALGLALRAGGLAARLETDYLIFATGREPEDTFLSEGLKRNAQRLEAAGELAFAGDVRSGIFRQAAIACGQGVMAGMKMARRLGESTG